MWRYVPVNQTEGPVVKIMLLVGVVEGRRQKIGDVEREFDRHFHVALTALLEDRPKIVSLDVLHCDVVRAIDLAEIIDVDDVVVVELSGELGFVDKHADKLVAVSEVGKDTLDGNGLLAIPPVAMCSSMMYWPNSEPDGAGLSDAGGCSTSTGGPCLGGFADGMTAGGVSGSAFPLAMGC